MRVVLAAGVAVVAAVAVLRPRRRRSAWHAVTVLAEPAAVPLDGLRGAEVRLERAPGDRGTEVHARLGRPATAAATRRLRAALRDAKSLAETGDVIRVRPRPHGRRRRTPWGIAQDGVERVSRGLGLG